VSQKETSWVVQLYYQVQCWREDLHNTAVEWLDCCPEVYFVGSEMVGRLRGSHLEKCSLAWLLPAEVKILQIHTQMVGNVGYQRAHQLVVMTKEQGLTAVTDA